MKTTMKLNWVLLFALAMTLVSSCKKDSTEPAVIASFTFQVDASDFKKVAFTNESTNFSTLSWDFGDQSALSTETDPVHTYAAVGSYTVKLTATSPGGVKDVYTTVVAIADPNEELTALVGYVSKTWKLIRSTSTGRYPLEVGPTDHSTIWWAMGLNNNEIANRPCMLDNEWTFTRAGLTMTYDPKGDFWAEDGIYAAPTNVCSNVSDGLVGKNGEDLSAWGGGTFGFSIVTGTPSKITVTGKGAFIGFEKLGDGIEVSSTNPIVVPTSITYDIIKLYDGTTDTLIVEGPYSGAPGYWRFTLVHYDNPADEPPIPGNIPNAGFTSEVNGLTVTFTNTTTGGTSYAWDFGDGQTSSEMNPVHTYTAGGPYSVKMTATNANGESTASQAMFVTSDVLTEAELQGGAWKVPAKDMVVFVGGGMGMSNWWVCPKANLDGTSTGGDDWSCMPDDEFIFSTGGVFEYKTNGSARNDGWWGPDYPNGCVTDAEIAGTPAPGPAFGSGIHSYVFTPASGGNRAKIVLTNGATGAAFLGFYKGYYGGENNASYTTLQPNGGNTTNQYEVMGYANTGTKEYLFVTVDITADHSGTASWSAILER
jgi:PKD repeat protein